ncbi:hypothetical protein DPMN_004653 [Dreissena polymorpha]|uniref:Uncharacterized protein n=1 Tax=Dreissena polymorpha TaxID=45954 RepID=A0A9D4MQP9_DREPO|nr:hypothetical protein DPMN_004653 [Dreissena polymorpha]
MATGSRVPSLSSNRPWPRSMKANPALYMLRQRIRKGLQLYSSELPELTMSTAKPAIKIMKCGDSVSDI